MQNHCNIVIWHDFIIVFKNTKLYILMTTEKLRVSQSHVISEYTLCRLHPCLYSTDGSPCRTTVTPRRCVRSVLSASIIRVPAVVWRLRHLNLIQFVPELSSNPCKSIQKQNNNFLSIFSIECDIWPIS